MLVDGGLDYEAIASRLVAGVASSADKKLSNQIDKYLYMIDQIYYIDENEHNVAQQTLYMKIIAMMCRDKDGRGLTEYQIQAGDVIFSSEK